MKRLTIILLTLLAIVGCEPHPVTPPTPKPPQAGDSAEMVLVCYFMGESNLSGALNNNISQMEKAVAEGVLGDYGRILIFMDSRADGCIYELYDKGGKCSRQMVKNYKQIDSADPEVMSSIMNDIKAMAPSNHYGLVFGGHGNGWVRKGLNIRDLNTYGSWTKKMSVQSTEELEHEGFWEKYYDESGDWKTRAVGYDVSRWMDISELAQGIKTLNPDFVLFDACSMASVEALWEMRDATRYAIVSAAEIMIKGFPYRDIVSSLFTNWEDLSAVCSCFVSSYEKEQNMPHATASLVDMSRLEGLSQAVSKVLSSARRVERSWLNNVDSLQYYEGITNHVFYDLGDCMTRLATDSEALAEFESAMEQAVLWEGHTVEGYSDYNSSTFPIKRSSGLTVYITRYNFPVWTDEYAKTEWAKDVGMIQYYKNEKQ